MHIAFLGAGRSVGTSANMAALAAGLMHYYSIPASTGGHRAFLPRTEGIFLSDCSDGGDAGKIIASCDLLALNVPIPLKGMELLYLQYSIVRRNVIFLIGKYFKEKQNELKRLAGQYRIPLGRICPIPYSPHFQRAYEGNRVMEYVKGLERAKGGYQDVFFQEHLKRAVDAALIYMDRKGELYYG